MRAKVICFASAKGGSGKTLISATLAKFLGGVGKSVLLIDVDAATNGLSLFYMSQLIDTRKRRAEEKTSVYGIFEATEREVPTAFRIDEATDMIPATYVMKQVEGISPESLRNSIAQTIGTFRDKYSYIILDAQAGSDVYAQIAMEVADEVVIVSEYDPISAQGVDRLRHLFPTTLSYDRTWILFNKVLPEFAKSLSDFLSAVRYLNPVPWDAEVVRAYARRRLAIDMERGSVHTLAVMQTAQSLFGEEIEWEIDHWKQDKEELLREPVRDQLDAIETEIVQTERTAIETEHQLRDLQQKPRRIAAELIVGLFAALAVIAGFATVVFASSTGVVLSIIGISLAICIPLIFTYSRHIERRSLQEMKKLEGLARAINLRLGDLKQRREKYKTLVESDLETFLAKREY